MIRRRNMMWIFRYSKTIVLQTSLSRACYGRALESESRTHPYASSLDQGKIGPTPSEQPEMSTPDPVQDLVEVLRRALTSVPTPAPPATTSAFPTASPTPSAAASFMAKPTPFTGSAEDCNRFLLQCSLVLEMQPHLYPDDRNETMKPCKSTAHVSRLLSGRGG
ncbi:hypothetical protein QTP86_011516 [Hemibagrus guttatus]|nr:hypothetical protein QTP86_011516 [Hemibagrus guttatus]